MLRRLLIPLLVAALSGVAATAAVAHGGDSGTAGVKRSTARYHDVAVAQKAGYGLLVDAKGIACIDMPGMGAMGVHYANGSLVGDGAIDPLRPEAMVYQPEDGHLRLVAAEYVVFQADWHTTHQGAPELFGHRFDATPSPNRYGLPAFYSLHAWIWKHNPAGMFAMWNPRVSCPGGHEGHAHR